MNDQTISEKVVEPATMEFLSEPIKTEGETPVAVQLEEDFKGEPVR